LTTDDCKPTDPKELTAEQLAFNAAQGSNADFAELARRFGPRLYNYFHQRIQNRQDCEDLVQETLVKAYLNIKRFKKSKVFSTWLYTIGIRLAVDYFRKVKKIETAEISNDFPDKQDRREDGFMDDDKQSLWALARSLPEKQYDALWLKYVEDAPVKEIARVLGITSTYVKVLLYRARMKLSKMQKLKRLANEESGDNQPLKELLSY